ncbi:DUF3854 domain-containing protein (plasmid) [Nostoc sp. UHCC 0302]|uniref:DUF3854 domain-containing protein n=1 Tax=Nostoc sp. UHCC 0302 TaxID=3134896 RepID=UPI00311CAC38
MALIAADYTIGQESFYVAISRARQNVKLYTRDKLELLELAQESKAKENALELLIKQIKETQKQSSAITVSVSPRVQEPVNKLSLAIAQPVLKAQPPVTEQVSLPVSRPVPLVTTSLETSSQKPVVKPIKRQHQTNLSSSLPVKSSPVVKIQKPPFHKQPNVFEKPVLKTAAPSSAFWIPQKLEETPNFIESNHWQEFFDSAIHPDIAAKNFESLQFNYAGGEHEAWERLMVSDKLNRTNTGRLSEGLIRAYSHLDAGGWWCDAGVDPRSFADLNPGKKPILKRWGCYKPNTPRAKKDENNQIIEGKFIKYEHPPKVELSIFLLDVPTDIAERIYSKHQVNPTEGDRQSGFWYCVWKYNLPCTITEGAKKAASLLSQGHAAIGLPGISAGYRSPKDKFGNKIAKSYLHEELAVFATPNRVFKFCFDYETKPQTKLNIERDISVTGRLLQKAGAWVKVVSLPGPDKGVDDFIAARGPLAYEKLSHEAMRLRDWQKLLLPSSPAAIEPPRQLTQSQRSLQTQATGNRQQATESDKLDLLSTHREDEIEQTVPCSLFPIPCLSQNQPIGENHDLNQREQRNTDTVANRENRGVEPENRVLSNEPSREPNRIESESLELLAAVSRDIECQEDLELGAISARINPSSTDARLRGQRATSFSRQVNPENSAVIDCTASDVSFEQSGNAKRPTTEQLLNTITENIQQSVVESALVETGAQLAEQLYGYQQQFSGAKTKLDDLRAAIAPIEEKLLLQTTADIISDFSNKSVVESTLIAVLPQLLEQLEEVTQQLALYTAIAQQSEHESSQKTVWAIAENIEQSLVESTLSITLPLLIKQLSPLKQQQEGVISRFEGLEAVITQIEQRISSQRTLYAITQNIEYSAVSSALTEALPQLIEQLSPLRQQLKKGIATFDKISTAIERSSQRLDSQKIVDVIAEDIEQLAVSSALTETLPQLTNQLSKTCQQLKVISKFDDLEANIGQIEQSLDSQKIIDIIAESIEYSAVSSALSETLPQLIEQLSQRHQHISEIRTTFDDLETAISQFEQPLSPQKTLYVISQNIERSLVESALAKTLPQLIEQLSQYRQQLKGGKATFDKISTAIECSSQCLDSQKTIDIIAESIEYSAVESALTQMLPQLVNQLSKTCQQQKASRTTFEGLGLAINQIEQELDSQKTIYTIAQNIEYSVVESALTQTLPQLIKQLSLFRQQQKALKPKFDKISKAIEREIQYPASQRIILSIAEDIEQLSVESALTQTLPQLIKQLSPLSQQLREGNTTFDKISTAIEREIQYLSSQRTLYTITDSIEQLSVESALTKTLPQLIKQLSSFRQQLREGNTTFDKVSTAIEREIQYLSSQRTLYTITDSIEQLSVESALTKTLPQLIKQLSPLSQQLKIGNTTLDKIFTAIEHEIQYLSSQRNLYTITDSIEQLSVESALTETLPQLIKQLSPLSQQLKESNTTFQQFEQLLGNGLVEYLTQKTQASEYLALNAISDHVAQETVASYGTVLALSKLKELLEVSPSQTHTEFTTALELVLDLIERLGHHRNHDQENVQLSSSKLTTNIEVESELSKESLKLHLKQVIQGLAREQLAEVVMEVGKYVKGEFVTGKKVSELFMSVTTDAKALTFEQKMNLVRQLIRDDKPSIMERLRINSPSPDDNGEHLRFRR